MDHKDSVFVNTQVIQMANESICLSIKRIKTLGADSPTLHNDALKVVAYLENLLAADAAEESDPDYQARSWESSERHSGTSS